MVEDMQHIKLVFESLCRALIRFFDNCSVKDDSVEYYRMELDLAHKETQKIIDRLLEPKITAEIETEQIDYKPIGNSPYKSWNVKRRELEQASRIKAIQLASEARIAIEQAKTTEELEDELGISNG